MATDPLDHPLADEVRVLAARGFSLSEMQEALPVRKATIVAIRRDYQAAPQRYPEVVMQETPQPTRARQRGERQHQATPSDSELRSLRATVRNLSRHNPDAGVAEITRRARENPNYQRSFSRWLQDYAGTAVKETTGRRLGGRKDAFIGIHDTGWQQRRPTPPPGQSRAATGDFAYTGNVTFNVLRGGQPTNRDTRLVRIESNRPLTLEQARRAILREARNRIEGFRYEVGARQTADGRIVRRYARPGKNSQFVGHPDEWVRDAQGRIVYDNRHYPIIDQRREAESYRVVSVEILRQVGE